MRASLIFLMRFAALAAALPILAGYAGPWAPWGDSFAVFRHLLAPMLAAAGAVLLILAARRSAMLALVLAGLAGVPILAAAALPPERGMPAVSLYQKNLLFRLSDPGPLLADIAAADPDLLTFQEVTPGHAATILEPLSRHYGFQTCAFAGVGGVAVGSRLPVIPGSGFCVPGSGITGLRVETASGPVWVVSVHMHWPWPYGQAEQLARILPHLQRLDGPVILGGDFNMVPWAAALDAIRAATGTEIVGPLRATIAPRGVPLPIDMVLGPAGGRAERRPRLGSDHWGVLADLPLSGGGASSGP